MDPTTVIIGVLATMVVALAGYCLLLRSHCYSGGQSAAWWRSLAEDNAIRANGLANRMEQYDDTERERMNAVRRELGYAER